MQAHSIRKAALLMMTAIVLSGCGGEPSFEDGFIEGEFTLDALVGFEGDVEGLVWTEWFTSLDDVYSPKESREATSELDDIVSFDREECVEFLDTAGLSGVGQGESEVDDRIANLAGTALARGAVGFNAYFTAREFDSANDARAYVSTFVADARACGGDYSMFVDLSDFERVIDYGVFDLTQGAYSGGGAWVNVATSHSEDGAPSGVEEHLLVVHGNIAFSVYSTTTEGTQSRRGDIDELVRQLAKALDDHER